MSSRWWLERCWGRGGGGRHGGRGGVEAADRFLFGLAVRALFGEVDGGAGVVADADDGEHVEGAVETPAPVHSDDEVRGWIVCRVITQLECWVAEARDRKVVGLLALQDGWVDQLYVIPRWQARGSAAPCSIRPNGRGRTGCNCGHSRPTSRRVASTSSAASWPFRKRRAQTMRSTPLTCDTSGTQPSVFAFDSTEGAALSAGRAYRSNVRFGRRRI